MKRSTPAPELSLLTEAAQLVAQGRLEDAERAYQKAVSMHPTHAQPLHALAVFRLSQGNLAGASQMLARALMVEPGNAVYQRDLAELMRRQGNLEAAEKCAVAATRLAPSDPEGWYALALVQTDQKLPEKAARSYREAVKVAPGHGRSWNNLGVLLEQADDAQGALKAYQRAASLDEKHAEAHNNLGAAYTRLNKLDEARKSFERALAARPDFEQVKQNLAALEARKPQPEGDDATAEALHMQGLAHYRQGQLEEALGCYERALALRPDYDVALNTKGFVLQEIGRIEEAIVCLEHCLNVAPQNNVARLNLAMAQLKGGRFQAGWENYEARWTGSAESMNGTLNRAVSALPQWTGEQDTKHLRLLVITEQGFGDTFQFGRYLSMAAERFARVGFACSGPTLRIMEWSFGDKLAMFARMPSDLHDWDLQCPLMSLPRAFGTTIDSIPSKVPYLKVPEGQRAFWKSRIERQVGRPLRIGIAWAGRKTHQFDQRRSIPFEMFAPILGDPRVAFVSLQKWAVDDVRPNIPAGVEWHDWTEELTDFADTAALLVNLDLVISVDSSMVHLAGGLDVPVWMLNRFDGEWRWGNHDVASPWYRSLQIFNQTDRGDWRPVIEVVGIALSALPVDAKREAELRAAPPPQIVRAIQPGAENPQDAAQAVEMASRHEVAGRLDDAERLLRLALLNEPTHANALNLLGVVLWRKGQQQDAIAFLEKAVAANPGMALFHSNLAEMQRQIGNFTAAISEGRKAVERDPSMASAHSNLGIALYDDDQLDEAEASHRTALQLQPQLLQSLNNLGSIERARGNRAAAASWYRRAIAIRPDYLESLSNLGAVLLEDERHDEALVYLHQALKIQPDYAQALCNLGLAHVGAERPEEAEGLLRRSLQIAPNQIEALIGLSVCLSKQDRFDESESFARQAIAIEPDSPDALFQLGSVLTQIERSEEGQAVFEKALEIDPEHIDAMVGLGNLKLENGQMKEAIAILERALVLDPKNVGACFHLVQAKKIRAGDPVLLELETLASAESMNASKQISLQYAMGKALDDLAQHEKSFEAYMRGASLKRSTLKYDGAIETFRVHRIAEIVNQDFLKRLKGSGDPSQVPIFILGMPRSGTTLTEQIIASHSQVFGAGELSTVLDVIQRPLASAQASLLPFPESLTTLTKTDVSAWGAEYLARLPAKAQGSAHVTDKMPANYLALGLIALMFPNAKIIHVMRDPIDTCVSCYTRLFARPQAFSYDLTELGQNYVAYARLMDHWRRVLPGRFLEVQYEDIVADLNGQARRLIDYCGLPWEDACLAFHETQRAVRTASVAQVRTPIYNSSVQRWRRVEKYLGPLIDALGEYAPKI